MESIQIFGMAESDSVCGRLTPSKVYLTPL